MEADLRRVREWADAKITAAEEPPWAWYQYMKLRETLDSILDGMAATRPEGLLQPEPRSGKHLRLVGSENSQDTSPHHPSEISVRLPM